MYPLAGASGLLKKSQIIVGVVVIGFVETKNEGIEAKWVQI